MAHLIVIGCLKQLHTSHTYSIKEIFLQDFLKNCEDFSENFPCTGNSKKRYEQINV